MDDLKVAIVTHEFPPYTFGGVASHCYDLAYSLSKIGVETTVFSGRSRKICCDRLNDHLKVVRVPLLDMPPRQLWFQVQNLKSLSRLLKDYTIIHGHGISSAVCVYLNRTLKKPLVSTIHGLPYDDLRITWRTPFSENTLGEIIYNLLEWPLNEQLTKVVIDGSRLIVAPGSAIHHQLVDYYRRLPTNKISVIPNGINLDKINNILSECKHLTEQTKFQGSPIISFCGRLYWRKGITHLVKAMSHLVKDFKDARLEIFGKGPLESKLQRLVLRLGLKNNVSLQGHVPYPKLIAALKKTDLAVFPSFYEVGPFISALEAMACKKAPIIFDFPFSREFITNMNNGVLVKPGDVTQLSEKMHMLLSDERLRERLGENAYKCVEDKLNWDLLVKKYIAAYDCLQA